MSKTTVIQTVCPNCGEEHDRATDPKVDSREPETGDYSICLSCHIPCKFDFSTKGKLVKLTVKELEELRKTVEYTVIEEGLKKQRVKKGVH